MSVKLILLCLTAIAASLAGASAVDAQLLSQSYVDFDVQPAALTSFVDDSPTAGVEQQLKKLDLRLRELELDVERKIDSAPESKLVAEAAADSTEKKIAELQKTIDKQSEAIGALEGKLPSLVQHRHKAPTMQIFGRIHMDYWSFPEAEATLFPLEGGNPQDRFNFRRLRLGAGGNLTDNMFYKYEGEFAGGNDVQYRDAYIGFDALPYLNTVIIGNHKRPYGLDHLNSSNHNIFVERPFIVEAFNQDARRLGISTNGYTEDEKFNWRYGIWNQQLTQGIGGYIGDHYQLELAGRLAATPWYDETSGGRGYAHFAISGSAGTPDGRAGSINNTAQYRTRPEARTDGRWLDTGPIAGANANYLVGLESVINVGSLQFTGEYMRNNVDRLDGVGEDVAFDGGYVQVGYFLTGEHMPWNRQRGTLGRVQPFENFFMVRDCDCNTQRGWGAWQVAARYSHADLTDFDIIGGEGDSLTLGLNWHWNPHARMQFNYITGDIDRAPTGFGDYQVFGVRLAVDF